MKLHSLRHELLRGILAALVPACRTNRNSAAPQGVLGFLINVSFGVQMDGLDGNALILDLSNFR
jgi:hypothetical protein